MAQPPAGSSLLFGALADSGRIKQRKNGSYRMVLKGIDEIDWFTDRPDRVAGEWSPKKLINKWASLFGDVEPNAQASFEMSNKRRLVTFEMFKPKLMDSNQTLSFKVRAIGKKNKGCLKDLKNKRLSDASLFIDYGTLGIECRPNCQGANLVGVNLVGSSLSETNLTGANLTGAFLANVNAFDTNFTDANLTRTNWSATVCATDTTETPSDCTNLDGTQAAKVINSNFTRANRVLPDAGRTTGQLKRNVQFIGSSHDAYHSDTRVLRVRRPCLRFRRRLPRSCCPQPGPTNGASHQRSVAGCAVRRRIPNGLRPSSGHPR